MLSFFSCFWITHAVNSLIELFPSGSHYQGNLIVCDSFPSPRAISHVRVRGGRGQDTGWTGRVWREGLSGRSCVREAGVRGTEWRDAEKDEGWCLATVVVVTFSSSCRSCLVLASREHMVCWGATTVQIHLPSLSWAELYTCQDSSGFAGSTWAGTNHRGRGIRGRGMFMSTGRKRRRGKNRQDH